MVRAEAPMSSSGYGSLQSQAQGWIEAVTGEVFQGEFEDCLRDGVKLCELINKIKPGTVRRVNPYKEGQKFKQMENISNFIRGCRAIGVPEYSLFETVDLFEGKDVGLVVKCLHALGGTVQLECPEFQGPHLGLKPVSRISPLKKAPGGAAKKWIPSGSPSSSAAPPVKSWHTPSSSSSTPAPTVKSWSTPSSGRPAVAVASPSADAAKTWTTSSSPSSSAAPPVKSWSTPSSGRPAAAVTSPSPSAPAPNKSHPSPAVVTTIGSSPAGAPQSFPSSEATEPPPPPFDHSASAMNGIAGEASGAQRPPPPPYNGTAQRCQPSANKAAAAGAASVGAPPSGSAGGRRLPPPAYRDDISSRFADSARVADRGSGPPGSGSGSINSSARAPRSPSPLYRAPASSSISQQQAVAVVTTAAVGRSQAPAYQEGMPAAQAPAKAPIATVTATAGNGDRQARPKSPVQSYNTTKASIASTTESTVASAHATPERTSAASPARPSPTGRGGGYGLDAELAAKREANYDYDAEAEAREWIEDVTGQDFEDEFGEELRNGSRLCNLINEIKPGAVRRVNDSKMPFKQMENISNFLKACRAVGVAEHSLFETVDLYEGKDIGLVVRCLHALGQTVQTSCPDYDGPRLGIRQTETNKREWTAEQQQQQMLNSSGAMSQLMAGSSKTMERGTVIKTGVTFGAAQSGTGDRSAGNSGWTMGSASTMSRSHIAKSGPTFGAEYAGPSGDNMGVSSQFTGGRGYS